MHYQAHQATAEPQKVPSLALRTKTGLLTILSLLYMRTQTLRLAEMTSAGSAEHREVNSCRAYNTHGEGEGEREKEREKASE